MERGEGTKPFNWSLLVQVLSTVVALALGGVIEFQTQRDHIAGLSEKISTMQSAIDGIRSSLPNGPVYDLKLHEFEAAQSRMQDDLRLLQFQFQKEREQLLAKRLVN